MKRGILRINVVKEGVMVRHASIGSGNSIISLRFFMQR